MKEKNSNKINKFLLVTTILSMTILLIGGTFSYFTLSTMSKMNALAVSAGKVRLGLGVSPVYTGYPIIPLKDEYINIAYKQKCKDDIIFLFLIFLGIIRWITVFSLLSIYTSS